MEELKKALEGLDVQYADIRWQEKVSTAVQVQGRDLTEASVRTTRGGSVRAFHRGGFALVTFTEPEEAKGAAETAAKLARLAGEGKNESLAPSEPAVDRVVARLGDDDPRKFSLPEKVELAKRYSQVMLGVSGVSTTSVRYTDAFLAQHFLSTEGADIYEERLYTLLYMTAIAAEGSNVQQRHRGWTSQRGFSTVLGLEAKAEEIAKEAVALLGAEKVEAGKYTVILDPAIAGVFIHEAFGHLSEADHMARDERMKEIMKPGRRFGPEILNVYDGPVPGEWGHYAYDDEGTPAKKTYLIKEGVLVGRLHSRHTAALMGEEPTGNARAISYQYEPLVRMSNTVIEPGEHEPDELFEGVERGLYVIDALGGQTELEMFTFSAQMAYLIENGRKTKLVRDVVLSGNVFETLSNVDMIAKDLRFWGGGCGKGGQAPLPVSGGAPHIRVKNVLVGGK